jgi:hypothetical protein
MLMDMNADEDADLVALICWLARARDTSLTTIQLVKYLYLADLYSARRKQGETLTGWPWAFVHFGPYCVEAMQAIDSAIQRGLIERTQYDSKYQDKDYYLHRSLVGESPAIADRVPFQVVSGLKAALQKWADDTAGLLDFVYFETEPMVGVEPREILDFRRARVPDAIPAPAKSLRLPEKKLRTGRELLASLTARTVSTTALSRLDTGPHDEAFLEAIGTDEDGEIESFSGVLSIHSLKDGEGDA